MKQKKVIVLYGPPGVGKLTVAQELLSQTSNLKLFHVHLLADLVSSIFETGTKEFSDVFTYLWFFLFKKALLTNVNGLILTLVYGIQTLEGRQDDQFFADILNVAKEDNIDIAFIKLACSDDELNRRVQSESRKKFNKITDPAILNKIRGRYKVDQQIPTVKSIIIDTTNLTSQQTVYKIKAELKID